MANLIICEHTRGMSSQETSAKPTAADLQETLDELLRLGHETVARARQLEVELAEANAREANAVRPAAGYLQGYSDGLSIATERLVRWLTYVGEAQATYRGQTEDSRCVYTVLIVRDALREFHRTGQLREAPVLGAEGGR